MSPRLDHSTPTKPSTIALQLGSFEQKFKNKQETTNKKQLNKIGFDAQRKKFLFEHVVERSISMKNKLKNSCIFFP